MTATSFDAHWPVYRRAARTVVVVDVVESVRLMELDEEDFVRRWQAFVGEVVTKLLPPHGGRLVKSLGDGLMVEFEAVPPAMECVNAMHSLVAKTNTAYEPGKALWLRVGANVADLFADEHDIYGSGVNLAARLAALGAAGETVVSVGVREYLTHGLDGDVEDMGECFLKHFAAPVRAYRVGGPAAPQAANSSHVAPPALQPAIAVIPFDAAGHANVAEDAIGELIADSVIAQLSRTAELRVISRLSSSALRGRNVSPEWIKAHLNASYVLSGAHHVLGGKLVVTAELVDLRDAKVVWATRVTGAVADLVQPHSELVHQIAQGAHGAVLNAEVQRSLTQPLPTLESFSLLLGAVSLMHRQSRSDFARSRELLEHLTERYPRSATARAWLAKWFAVCSAQSWSASPERDALMARGVVDQALSIEPGNALAWAIKGLLHGYVGKDFGQAAAACQEALAHNPNEPLAWLYLGVLSGWRGDAAAAVEGAEAALRLSPLDPMKYYFDSLAAGAMLGARQYDRAIELAKRSIRLNAAHVATYKVLTIAQVLSGDASSGAASATLLLARQSDFTASSFLRVSPWAISPDADAMARALIEAGVPRG